MASQLLHNGRVYSASSPDATAMAVTDGTVVWLGADRPGRALHPDAEMIDLEGAFVAPAFVDCHVHATATGLAFTGVDLSESTSRQDCLDRLARHCANTSDALIWASGWDDSRWPDSTSPTQQEIDTIAGDHQVYLARVDAHSALASSALLAAAGLDLQSQVVTGHEHHRLRERAIAGLSRRQRRTAQLATLDVAAARGIVAVHECAGPAISGRADLTDLLELDHGVQVRGYWGEAVDSAEQAKSLLAETGAHGLGGDLFVDGSLGSRTAWLTDDYADAPGHRGHSYLDRDQIHAHLLACTQVGVQAGFHAIGDAAVTAVLDAMRRAVEQVGLAAFAARGHRIEHVEMVSREQAAELGKWAVVASVQPQFDVLWGGMNGMYADRLGADRAIAMNPFAALAAAGSTVALGSDSPVTALDPWASVRAAVVHHMPGFGLSPRAAFTAATRGAWRAGGVRDGVTGTLEPGAPASYAVWETGDLVMAAGSAAIARWSTDPRSRVPPLPSMADEPRCLRTVHRGRVLYAQS